MYDLQNILSLCKHCKAGDYSPEEFQSRVQTALLPDGVSKEYLNFLNDLEEVIYFYPESEHKERTLLIANEIVHATALEQKRLESIKMN